MKETLSPDVRLSVTSLTSGNVVLAGYRRRGDDVIDCNRFVGFKVGGLEYSNLKLLKQAFGVKNLRDLEAEVDRLELGSVTAEFFADKESHCYYWGAYLWNGAFRVGTSADRLVLEVA